VRGGRIIDVGTTPDIERRYQARHVIDAAGALVTPGFVDPHSHLLYSGPARDGVFVALCNTCHIVRQVLQ
jgi:imidazolonepropionase-like amidohydrolase